MIKSKYAILLFVAFLACVWMLWQPLECQAKRKTSRNSTTTSPVSKPKEWGFGLIIGDPTGVTAKYWQNKNVAYEFALGSQLARAGIGVHADYLYHLYIFADQPQAPIYLGGGIFLGGSADTISGGGRGVAGWSYLFDEPFEIFMQLSPSCALLPEIDFFFSFSIGARLYI
ncbi:hypothetical protein KAR34_09795 [bacterium]|nr:hypothetical protein [bacterium]